jgi:hypothetical protein
MTGAWRRLLNGVNSGYERMCERARLRAMKQKRRGIRADLRRRDGLLLGRVMVPEGTPFILSLTSGKYFDRTKGAQYVERQGQGYV